MMRFVMLVRRGRGRAIDGLLVCAADADGVTPAAGLSNLAALGWTLRYHVSTPRCREGRLRPLADIVLDESISATPSGTDPRLDRIASDFAWAHLAFEVVPDIVPFTAAKLAMILPNVLDRESDSRKPCVGAQALGDQHTMDHSPILVPAP